ncbi:cytochrome d ubiquinol oxidase subunit II [Homoserinibacter sp. YIM 151385]|uniref:cytochrome d ubiquinol oxidase subunit II n=1 Tax=Homoserinibacter sp. YIM 151385 TaxID=2985506 RepID=UPI0022F112B0|nr:cytochrome d ubiquinol oxidase subunit II [Homoserinibacter sp. YIM 151385]WBU38704.1 cytochrome d ubiquinol oxidase subunit II [Homoserinibacter sp. YIM 151385]
MDVLPTVWFAAVAFLWIGYLLLEGFDLGVGMHMVLSARTERRRRLMLNTIGPVWDGNEVWLITAGAATFAAFPLWYASLFSTLYVPLTVVVLALIFRAVGIEYRGKGKTGRWTRAWDRAIAGGSLVAAFGVGALLALTTLGLPIDGNGDRVGGPLAWLGWEAVLGGLAVVGYCLVHGAVFLALKTEGEVRERAGRFTARWLPLALLPMALWAAILAFQAGRVAGWVLIAVAAAGAVWAWDSARRGREGRAFLGMAAFAIAGAAAVFSSAYPVVIPSTIDPAFDLTVSNASSGDYTLGVMTWVAAFGLPVILVYQTWTYWVFRRRLAEHHIPEPHLAAPAVRR